MKGLRIRTLTAERWPDLEVLFGPNGAWGGCWCMFLRLGSKDYEAGCRGGGESNRKAFRRIVRAGGEPGLLAYRDERPVGWVAVAPRQEYGRILRSPIHKPVDDADGVYSVSCFYVAQGERGQGVADALLTEAARFARRKGARMLEAYPNDTGDERKSADAVWRGTLAQFERAGYRVIARRKPARPIVRLPL